jgi:hypothetical protein
MSDDYKSDISNLDYIWIYGYDLENYVNEENIEKFITFINENVKTCKSILFDLQGEGDSTETYLQLFDRFRSKISIQNYVPKILWNVNKKVSYKDYDIFYTKYYELVYWYRAKNITNLRFDNKIDRKYFLSFLNGKLRPHRKQMLKLILSNLDRLGTCLVSNLDNTTDIPYMDVGGWEETKNKFASGESLIRNSYINLVSESSGKNSEVIFITEKSIKPFVYQQIPIFLATPGIVQHLRQYGFDLFDDIINHSYDKETNLDIRCEMILEQLLNIKTIDLRKYFEINENRLLYNFNIYHQMTAEIENVHNILHSWIINNEEPI